MHARRIIGIIILIGGIVMLFISHYIKEQVAIGRGQISSAQSKMNQTNSLFSLSPATKQLGEGMSKSAQKKLDKYRKEADYYEHVAETLEIIGWIATAGGALLVFIPTKKKKK